MLQLFTGWSYLILGGIYFIGIYVYPGIATLEAYTGIISISREQVSYVSAIVAFVTLLGFFKIIESQIHRLIAKIFAYYKSDLWEMIMKQMLSLLKIAKFLLVLWLATYIAILPESLDAIIWRLIWVLYSLLILYFVTQAVKIFFEKKIQDAEKIPMVNSSLLPFLKKVFIALIWVLWLVSIASNMGYNITGLLAWAWVLGLAIGLAAQKSIANIFWAVTIFLNKPFIIGDYVKLDEHIGTVRDISLSYITLSDMTGHDVMIPNEVILSSSIENYSKRGSRRSDFSVWVVYDTSKKQLEKAVQIIEDILQSYQERGIITNYRVNFDSFGDFSLNINATYFSTTLDYTEFLKERETINLAIKEQYEKAKISMAFPTQEVIIKK